MRVFVCVALIKNLAVCVKGLERARARLTFGILFFTFTLEHYLLKLKHGDEKVESLLL